MTAEVQEFIRKEPRAVEAVRWLPETPSSLHDMVDWLTGRRCEFRVSYIADEPFRGTPILGVESNRNPQDFDYAWPGDWIMREGAQVYQVVEDERFLLHYGEVG